jgi:uncharacterized protein (TIGR02246 family)
MRDQKTALRDAQAVFDRFLAAFSAADPGGIVALFWPDALVWGTTMRELGTCPDAVRAYFEPIGRRPPGTRRAVRREGAALVVSDAVVLISGSWAVEPGPEAGQDASIPLRISLAITRRGEAWRISQFHSSPG